MVTLKEIARECNVSATTVSNILNGKPKVSEATRQKVMQVVKKRGYQPNYVAQGLRNQRTRTIAVIAEDIGQFTTPGIIESVMARFESEGYHTILWNLRLYARWSESWYNNEQAYRSILNPVLQELRSIKVEGVIYVAGHARLIHCTTQDYEVPMIMAYAYPDLPGIPSVTIDEEKSGYDMVKYLLSMGHRRIGFIGGRANNIHTQRRLYGAQRAMFESHVPYNPEWVRYGDWFRRSGYEEAGPLVQAGVTAISVWRIVWPAAFMIILRKKGCARVRISPSPDLTIRFVGILPPGPHHYGFAVDGDWKPCVSSFAGTSEGTGNRRGAKGGGRESLDSMYVGGKEVGKTIDYIIL